MAFLEAVAGALAARPVRGVGLAYRLAVDLQRSFFVPPASISRPQHLTARRLRMAAERTPLHRSRRGAL